MNKTIIGNRINKKDLIILLFKIHLFINQAYSTQPPSLKILAMTVISDQIAHYLNTQEPIINQLEHAQQSIEGLPPILLDELLSHFVAKFRKYLTLRIKLKESHETLTL